MALFCNEMRSHAEPSWQPASVQFCHRAPDDLGMHRRFFGPTLAFDQDRNAVRIQAELLARPLAAADERSRRMMSAVLAGRQSRTPQAALSRIEGAIRSLMPFSACSIGEVAGAIATSPRTLQRQLAENGTTFQKVRDQIRADLALKYLRQSTLQLGEISEILGFAEPSVFTRSFRRWHGCTPRDARQRIAAAPPGTTPAWTPMPIGADRALASRRPCTSSSSAAASSSAPRSCSTRSSAATSSPSSTAAGPEATGPTGVQAIVGDRAGDLGALAGKRFDAVDRHLRLRAGRRDEERRGAARRQDLLLRLEHLGLRVVRPSADPRDRPARRLLEDRSRRPRPRPLRAAEGGLRGRGAEGVRRARA